MTGCYEDTCLPLEVTDVHLAYYSALWSKNGELMKTWFHASAFLPFSSLSVRENGFWYRPKARMELNWNGTTKAITCSAARQGFRLTQL